MSLITFQDVSFGHGPQSLLTGLDFTINERESVCLVGRNGSGKTTLLNLLMGRYQPDGGRILRRQNLRVSELPQEVPDLEGQVLNIVAQGLEVEAGQGEKWEEDHRVLEWIQRVGLSPQLEASSLSAGMKRRVLLARALVSDPDLLVLDEPTNHLDLPSIESMEELLKRWGGALLFISHDRTFCRGLGQSLLALDRGSCRKFDGDFDTCEARRAEQLRHEDEANRHFDKKLEEEERWIRQGIKARRTRNEGRVRALEQMRVERQERREGQGQVKFALQEAELSGRKVIEAKSIDFSYVEEEPLVKALSLLVERGDRLAVLGPNGCGKTTLIRLLLGDLKPTRGSVVLGTGLQVAMFDQLHSQLDPDRTVQDNLAEGASHLDVFGKRVHVLGYLRRYLFPAARAQSPVKHLSGGERNRLLLAKLFSKPSNLLILDEPTNDLDAETLDLLVEVLGEYTGTVLVVSHDRDFIDRIATSTLVYEPNGLKEYVGGYSDWVRQRSDGGETQKTHKVKRLDDRERRELFNLPAQIEKLEQKQASIHERMAEPGFYEGDAKEVEKWTEMLKSVDEDVEKAYERWEQLEERKGEGD